MPNLNKVMLMGNLTRDPELRYLPSNTAVVGFGMAVNRQWRSQEGEQREETTFVDCSAFGRVAELINQYLKKGRPVYVDGRLRYEQWQDKQSGANRSKISIVVENFQFLDSRGSEAGEHQSKETAVRSGDSHTVDATQPAEPHQAVEEEDIPF